MDVRCNRCGTEYELDDARVAQSGTTVKCSSCGHIFKVLQSGQIQLVASKEPSAAVARAAPETPALGSFPATPQTPSPAAPAEWMVKKADGQTFRFRELTTLQKWIVERKVGRDDEISRSGKSWKRLGEIAELTSFFQVVEAAEAAQRAPGFQGPAPAPQMPNIQLAGSPTGTITAVSTAPAAADVVVPSAPPITLAPTPRPERQPEPPRHRPAPTVAAREDLDGLDDDDPVLAWQRKRKTMMAVVVAAGAALLVAVIVAVLGAGQGGLDVAVESAAQEALQSDDGARRDAALQLLEPHAEQAGAQAWRARLLAARAQALLDEARLRDHLSKLDQSAVAPAPTNAEQLLAEATADVVALRAKEPLSPQVDLAAAAIALAKGDSAQLSSDVALAQAHAKALGDGPAAVTDTEARLLLTLAEAHRADDAVAAKASLQKLQLFTDGRARAAAVVVAVGQAALARTKDTPAPKDLVDAAAALVAQLPDSEPRKELAQKILAAAAAVAAVRPAPPVPPTPETPTTPTTPTPALPPAPSGPETYEVLMQKAEKALVGERSQAAYDLLKKAVALRPEVARPWLKLGWAALDLNRHGEAQRAFKRAIDTDGALSEAQFGLAESLRFGGKKDEALAAYKAYLQLDPSGKEANIARNAIQQLE